VAVTDCGPSAVRAQLEGGQVRHKKSISNRCLVI